nr:uncharacterized protein CTRU02_12997 [Colletotrichum truncatum]KAF6783981.1 hypothetical protein CTRU02_12997 [Colletotrichum truncatum]
MAMLRNVSPLSVISVYHIKNTDIDDKKALVNDLVRRVVQKAISQIKTRQCLVDEFATLRNVAESQGVLLDEQDEIPNLQGAVRSASVDLRFDARWIAERHVRHLIHHGGLAANKSVRYHFLPKTRWINMISQTLADGWFLPETTVLQPDFMKLP